MGSSPSEGAPTDPLYQGVFSGVRQWHCICVWTGKSHTYPTSARLRGGGIVRDPWGHTLGWVCQGRIQAPWSPPGALQKCNTPVKYIEVNEDIYQLVQPQFRPPKVAYRCCHLSCARAQRQSPRGTQLPERQKAWASRSSPSFASEH